MSRFPVLIVPFVLVGMSPVYAEQGEPEAVFGQSLMSAEEVTAHKSILANCRSEHERQQIRYEHKDRMVQRARWKALALSGETTTVSLSETG